jgi:hypothetical protein
VMFGKRLADYVEHGITAEDLASTTR